MNLTPANKSADQSANEPSMEEILASIRRIIADEKMLPLSQSASAPPVRSEREQEPLLRTPKEERRPIIPPVERSQSFETPSLRVLQGGLPKFDMPAAPEFVEPAPIPSIQAPEVIKPSLQASEPAAEDLSFEYAAEALEAELTGEPLMSATADASVASSFQTLANTIFLQNSSMVEQTLRDLLRPMLKQWLDQNLPPVVERLVKSEIERVARGGR